MNEVRSNPKTPSLGWPQVQAMQDPFESCHHISNLLVGCDFGPESNSLDVPLARYKERPPSLASHWPHCPTLYLALGKLSQKSLYIVVMLNLRGTFQDATRGSWHTLTLMDHSESCGQCAQVLLVGPHHSNRADVESPSWQLDRLSELVRGECEQPLDL